MSADREDLPTSGTTPDRAHRSEDAVLEQAREAIRLLFGPPASRSCAVRYWDGSVERPAAGHANQNSRAVLMCLGPKLLV